MKRDFAALIDKLLYDLEDAMANCQTCKIMSFEVILAIDMTGTKGNYQKLYEKSRRDLRKKRGPS